MTPDEARVGARVIRAHIPGGQAGTVVEVLPYGRWPIGVRWDALTGLLAWYHPSDLSLLPDEDTP